MVAPKQTLYEVIGVSPTASTREIEAACLDLGSRYRSQGSEDRAAWEQFAAIERAYEILRDPATREIYDRELKAKARRISIAGVGVRSRGLLVTAVGGLAVVALGLLLWFALPRGSADSADVEEMDAQKLNDYATRLLTQAVISRLKDPDSVRFRNVKHYAVYWRRTDGSTPKLARTHTICGEVNAKNAFGGYVGFRPFIASGYIGKDAEIDADTLMVDIARSQDGRLSAQPADFCRDEVKTPLSQ